MNMAKKREIREMALLQKYVAEGRDMDRVIAWWERATCGSVTRTEDEVIFHYQTLGPKITWSEIKLPVW